MRRAGRLLITRAAVFEQRWPPGGGGRANREREGGREGERERGGGMERERER